MKKLKQLLEEEANAPIVPPSGVQSACKRGLELKDEYGGDGLTPAAVSWARKIANGEAVSPEKLSKMNAYFARHKVDKKKNWDSPPTPGYVAWLLWGGDAGRAWASQNANKGQPKK